MVSLIGEGWLECQYDETIKERGYRKGKQRLENPDDYVRVELEYFLKRRDKKQIILVLHDRESFDDPEDFPDSTPLLAKIPQEKAIIYRPDDPKSAVQKLCRILEEKGLTLTNAASEKDKEIPNPLFLLNEHYPLAEWESDDPRPKQPFVGLRPFREEEARLFFGRSQEIYDLCEVLMYKDYRVHLFYGLSGVGKSSILQAGILPRMKAREWDVSYRRRENDSENGLPGILESLKNDRQKTSVRELWIIDQVEEALHAPDGEDELQRFASDIAELTAQEQSPKIMLSFRSEYLPQITEQFDKVGVWDGLFVKPLDEEKIEEAITGVSESNIFSNSKVPFERFSFGSGLVECIQEDILKDEDSKS